MIGLRWGLWDGCYAPYYVYYMLSYNDWLFIFCYSWYVSAGSVVARIATTAELFHLWSTLLSTSLSTARFEGAIRPALKLLPGILGYQSAECSTWVLNWEWVRLSSGYLTDAVTWSRVLNCRWEVREKDWWGEDLIKRSGTQASCCITYDMAERLEALTTGNYQKYSSQDA